MRDRLVYIDALRALAILFIVFGHLPMYAYGEAHRELISVRSFTSMVQIPLFFFISGFLYSTKWIKEHNNRTAECCGNRIGGGKIFYLYALGKRLLIPILVWGMIYCTWQKIPYMQAVVDMYKAGYWFTFTLFEFYIMQMLLELIARRFAITNRSLKYILMGLGVSVVSYLFLLPLVTDSLGIFSGLLGVKQMHYYFFFFLGILVRIYLYDFKRCKYKEQVMAGITLLFVGLAVSYWIIGAQFSGVWFHALWILFQMTGLLLLFAFFYHNRNFFIGGRKIPVVMSYIGQRTLDIYLLHYFFLPKDLYLFGSYFVAHEAIVIEALFAGIVTFTIVAECAVCSELLRRSRIIRDWLLGGK